MTKMDELGNKSYESFMDYYKRLWKLYKRYGDRVIEVEFEEEGKEGQDDVKNIFLEAKGEGTFDEALNALWKEKYQTIINSCADIEKVFSELNSAVKDIYVYPEHSPDNNSLYYISKEFWEKLSDNEITDYTHSYVYTNECVYEIFVNVVGRRCIRIEKKIPISSMLKDE